MTTLWRPTLIAFAWSAAASVGLVLLAVVLATAADARPRHFSDPRPRAWCGWFMRQQLGVADTRFNLAREWARYGSRAHGPAVGTIVVWPHHVGKIVGQASRGLWLVMSGNDGHQVRTRPRSVARAIAFRWPA